MHALTIVIQVMLLFILGQMISMFLMWKTYKANGTVDKEDNILYLLKKQQSIIFFRLLIALAASIVIAWFGYYEIFEKMVGLWLPVYIIGFSLLFDVVLELFTKSMKKKAENIIQ